MLRFLRNTLLFCLLLTALPVLWLAMTANDDVFDTRKYHELLGARLAVTSPALVKDLQVVAAAQNTRFQMDEQGVKLRSESHVSFSCGEEAPPVRKRVMVFDKPFLIMLQRSEAKMPYFALWVGNAELLRHADGNER
jgi:hypothetical protein